MTSTPIQHRGVSDFLRLTEYVIYPKWSIVMVKAPLEEVIKHYQSLQNNSEEVLQSIPVEVVPDGNLEEPLWQSITLVQLLDNSWTIIYRSIQDCFYGEAQTLSQELRTEAINLCGEDIADVMEYQYFTNGDQIEFGSFSRYGEILAFESPNCSQPELELIEDDVFPEEEEGKFPEPSHNQVLLYNFLDDLFSEKGIYVPVCYPVDKEDGIQLVVWEKSAKTIASASVVYST